MATTFPRTIIPRSASGFEYPGPFLVGAQAGKLQARAFGQMGRRWTEEFPPILLTDAAARGWLAQVQSFWSNGTFLDVVHRSYLTPNGSGAGTPLVNGASQVGASLNTKGWATGQTVLKAGDLIRIAGLNVCFDILADAVSDGSGLATLSINPPIPTGSSPADNAALTVTAVPIRCLIIEPPNVPLTLPGNGYLAGVRLVFREAP